MPMQTYPLQGTLVMVLRQAHTHQLLFDLTICGWHASYFAF